ncbi:hypothetical protein ACFPN1_03465 [Lysobacter yangpyeongensis]|jgi:hypothetical protein|uniref:DUF4136 domain-containing protein n=1 Tax=Lysobacter yangpyeongensis TaxID=346182 RepID=A0ABW0SKA8_9GAMM
MRTFAIAMLLCLAPVLVNAAEPATPARKDGDPAVRQLLDKLEYKYEIDEEGDYRLTFGLGDDKDARSQLVYVRSPVETYGSHKVREIWSPGYVSTTDEFPADVANRLLEATQQSKLGAWAKQGRYAVFVVKVAADASAEELDDAVDAALRSADEIEQELTPGKDDF